ncbi:MAG: M20/M25/M40 family metallo-hydrolase [Polyangiaceae bacterium]|nr:M20/M25/M40 family metallo-hydrolase [Polyangiaceae bacterium]MCB9609079.1 M20/M25/M40 family metallo-hydrolase [Polyangiaceae bacterium]
MDALELLRDYIAIPSVNSMGRDDLPESITGEARYAQRVAQDFSRLGLDHQLIGSEGRLSVFAEARCAEATDTVLIASHLDTVPVDTMTIDPFDPEVKAGVVYGRGATDTKGGLAAAVAALAQVLSRGKLKRNVILAGQADEESGSIGAYDIIRALSDKRPLWGIATEPTELRVVNQHKGVARVTVTAQGVAAHSSDPSQGDNAIIHLCHGLLKLQALGGSLAERRDPVLGPPTLSVGVVRGGHAPNIVPDRATALVDRRMIPGETHESLTAEFAQALAGSPLTFDCHVEKPPLGVPQDSPAVVACGEALRALGLESAPTPVAFGTDAGLFDEAGMPCIVWGPGSILQAHTKDEYLKLEQLEAATRFFVRLFGG